MIRLFSNLTSRDYAQAGLIACLTGVVYYLYHFVGVSDVGYFYQDATRSIFEWSITRWRSDFGASRFAFAIWAPLISLLMIVFRWKWLARLPRQACWPALSLVFLAVILHWVGLKTEQTRISAASLILMLWALPFATAGWLLARQLLFPAAVLIFFMPLNFLDVFAYKAQTLSATLAAILLSGLGLEVVRSGSSILSADMPGMAVGFADQFSHLQVYLSQFAVALMCTYFMQVSWRIRIIYLAAAPMLMLLSNGLRGLLVVIGCHLAGTEDAVTMSGSFSMAYTLLVPFGLVMALSRQLNRKYRLENSGVPTAAAVKSGSAMGPLAASLVLLIGASLLMPRIVHVQFIDRAGVNLDIPAALGDWNGRLMVFCHNPAHPGDPVVFGHRPGDACPGCGQALDQMMPYEKLLMPPDTIVRKHQYLLPDKSSVVFTTVLSGEHRGSIHRPEVCLVGGEKGTQIETSFVHPVALPDGRTLRVKILEMNRVFRQPDGSTAVYHSYYAYWFAGINRETPSHIERMIWMASDRLFKGISYRWAYNSVSSIRRQGNRDYLSQLDGFIRAIHPHLHAEAF